MSGLVAGAAPDPLFELLRPLFVASVCLALGLGLWSPHTERGARFARTGDLLLTLVLSVLANIPRLLNEPTNDTLALRVGYARHLPLGDWNHPPLSYLLNLPAHVSLEPVVVRLSSLLWFVVLAWLVQALAARLAGRSAGTLAMLWFVFEAARRVSVENIADWDLAGIFLMWTVLWLYDRRNVRWLAGSAAAAELAVLGVAGLLSSYLMLASSLTLAGVLWLGAAGRRVSVWLALAATAVCGLGAPSLWTAFWRGAQVHLGVPAGLAEVDLMHLWLTTSAGRHPAMALPLVVGVVWVTRRALTESWARFSLGLHLAIPGAVVVAAARSHVNGAYYADLVAPLTLAIAAAAVVILLGRGLPESPRWRAAAVAWIAGLTFTQPIPLARDRSVFAVSGLQLAQAIAADPRPVLLTQDGLNPWLHYELARVGFTRSQGMVMPDGEQHLPHERASRMRTTTCAACLADVHCVAFLDDAWVVAFRTAVAAEELACIERLASVCERVSDPGAAGDGYFLRCRGLPAGSTVE